MDNPGTNWRRVYTLRDFSGVLFRQAPTATLCFFLVVAFATVAILFMPDRYESEMRILVKHDRADTLISVSPGSDRALPPDITEQELNSEIELLQGPDLLAQVAQAVKLEDRLDDGSWNPVPRWIDSAIQRVRSTGVRPAATASEEKLARAVQELRNNLQVEPVRRTWMISVTYTSSDPKLSKEVLESLSKLYLEKHLAVRRAPGTRQFFVEQATQSAKDLEAIQGQLREFGERNGTVSAATEKDAVLAKLADFEGQVRQANAAVAEATARLTSLQLERARTPARHVSSITTGDASGLTQEMQSKILAMELKRTELLQKYTPQYRMVVELSEQIEQTRAALENARTSSLKQETTEENPTMRWLENEISRVRTEHSAMSARSKALQAALDRYRAEAQMLSAADFEQSDLLRAMKAAEDRYSLYQRKEEEARISDALDRTRISNVAVVQAATLPFEPMPRRSLMWLGLAMLVAMVMALGVAFVKDLIAASVRVRTPDELQSALADVPVLAWVPETARRA
jgi:uncharacterized protein involved in exopolysaccharide biosynthesis